MTHETTGLGGVRGLAPHDAGQGGGRGSVGPVRQVRKKYIHGYILYLLIYLLIYYVVLLFFMWGLRGVRGGRHLMMPVKAVDERTCGCSATSKENIYMYVDIFICIYLIIDLLIY